jgi:hypothetical protein
MRSRGERGTHLERVQCVVALGGLRGLRVPHSCLLSLDVLAELGARRLARASADACIRAVGRTHHRLKEALALRLTARVEACDDALTHVVGPPVVKAATPSEPRAPPRVEWHQVAFATEADGRFVRTPLEQPTHSERIGRVSPSACLRKHFARVQPAQPLVPPPSCACTPSPAAVRAGDPCHDRRVARRERFVNRRSATGAHRRASAPAHR